VIETDELALAATWIALQHTKSNSRAYEEKFWSFEEMDRLRRSDPERCWSVILTIFDQARTDDVVLSNLAAGPLEDLLADHGERFIGRVETLARQEPRFRFTTQMVWRNSISAPVWARLRKAATLDP
jgi:hypothetical protein